MAKVRDSFAPTPTPTGVLNPSEYMESYQGNKYKGMGDIPGQALADMMLMDAQYQYDSAWYDNFESASARSAEYAKLGMNPLDINRMLLGGAANDSGSSSPSVSATDRATDVQALNAVSGMIGAINGSIQTDLNMQAQEAKINNLNSQSALNFANAGMVNPIGESQIFKNYASGNKDVSGSAKDYQDIEESSARVELIGEQYNLTKEQTRHAKQLADAFPDMNQAELNLKKAQTSEYLSQASLNYSEIEQNVHENAVLDADKVVKESQSALLQEEKTGQTLENEGQRIQNSRNDIALGLEQIIGAPLTADDKKVIMGYVERNDFKGLDNYIQAAYDMSNPPVEGSIKNVAKRIYSSTTGKSNSFGIYHRHHSSYSNPR